MCDANCIKHLCGEWSGKGTADSLDVLKHKHCGLGTVLKYTFPDKTTKEYGLFEIKKNPALATELIDYFADSYHFLPEELKMNKDVAFYALKSEFNVYESVPKELREDRAFILSLVKMNGKFLAEIEKFRDDPEIVLEAVKQCPYMIVYASERIRSHLGIKKTDIQWSHDFCDQWYSKGKLSPYQLTSELSGDIENMMERIQTDFVKFKEGTPSAINDVSHWVGYLQKELAFIRWSTVGKSVIGELEKMVQ